MAWLKARLSEPSTHAALAGLMALLSTSASGYAQGAAMILAGIFAILGISIKEGS